MNRPQISVALRLFHPDLDPERVSSALGINPQHAWKAGEPRRTPEGESLPGVYPSGYWSIRRDLSEEAALDEFLASWVRELEPHASLLQEISSSGGNAEFYVIWKYGATPRDTLGRGLLLAMAALGIDLSLEVFGRPPHGDEPPAE
ncbi:DUF4279 domain-containing protein [Myxococcus xanthus]|uniref:DUF4279 domain-containing protein n=1 Tax=Myxococcus xanthus TaxID=34 RepID=A0A7Y4IJB8_MYXXA|nr:DUF4279 domain-containing protein [Myxococcus xanthus]NOJ88000.1 DUF4279 domain-containing protein [Myxococcus xanthus]